MLFVLALCLCFTAVGAAFAETAAADKPAAEMTAEELYQAGRDAYTAEDYEKALEYFQLAADLGNAKGLRAIGNLYFYGLGVELSTEKAIEYYQRAADHHIKSIYAFATFPVRTQTRVRNLCHYIFGRTESH